MHTWQGCNCFGPVSIHLCAVAIWSKDLYCVLSASLQHQLNAHGVSEDPCDTLYTFISISRCLLCLIGTLPIPVTVPTASSSCYIAIRIKLELHIASPSTLDCFRIINLTLEGTQRHISQEELIGTGTKSSLLGSPFVLLTGSTSPPLLYLLVNEESWSCKGLFRLISFFSLSFARDRGGRWAWQPWPHCQWLASWTNRIWIRGLGLNESGLHTPCRSLCWGSREPGIRNTKRSAMLPIKLI